MKDICFDAVRAEVVGKSLAHLESALWCTEWECWDDCFEDSHASHVVHVYQRRHHIPNDVNGFTVFAEDSVEGMMVKAVVPNLFTI